MISIINVKSNILFIINVLFVMMLPIFDVGAQAIIPEKGVVFNDAVVARIDIRINEDSLKILLLPGNQNSDEEYPADFFWDDGIRKDSVMNVGFRLRGNTSRAAAKKSFKVKFNHFGSDKFYGLSDLNLNGEHNDPSIIRSKLCWDLMAMAGIESPRSNHVALYINNRYMGLYINVEHIDNDYFKTRSKDPEGQLFKCYYGSNFVYKGSNPASYSKSVYQPENHEQNPDYLKFIEFLKLLNDTSNPDFVCNLEKIFDVNGYLQRMAMEILTGHWDNPIYNKNNAYLYFNPSTGKFELLSYDIDNTLGVDWSNINWATRNIYQWAHPTDPRPIYNNLMKVPEYKTIFGFYVKKYAGQFLNRTFLDPYIDNIKNKIEPFRLNDTFASKDYGYTYADFLKSYDNATGAHVKSGLKEFIGTRNSSIQSQLQNTDIAPIVDHISTKWAINFATLQFRITKIGNVSVTAVLDQGKGFELYTLKDDGILPDLLANDDIYTMRFGFEGKPSVAIHLEVTDQLNKKSRWPKCHEYTFIAGNNPVPKLIINEFMAENSTLPDLAGEFDDWVEIYNADNKSIWLGDKYLTDKAVSPDKWKLPDITLEPGQFLLIWADEDQEQGHLHANFKLSKSGEFIGIFDSKDNNYAAIDSFSFGQTLKDKSYGRYPDGFGPVIVLNIPTPGKSNVLSATIDEAWKEIKTYPVPARERIIIDGTKSGDKIIFSDLHGVTLLQMVSQGQKSLQMDTGHLAKGIYMLSIARYSNIISKQIIIQ